MFKTLIATAVLISSMSLAVEKPQAHELWVNDNGVRKTRVLSHEEMLFPNKQQDVTGQSKAHSNKMFSEWSHLINKINLKSSPK